MKRIHTWKPGGQPIRNGIPATERYRFARFPRQKVRICTFRLYTYDPNVRCTQFHRSRYPGSNTAARDRHEYLFYLRGILNHFETYAAVTCDH